MEDQVNRLADKLWTKLARIPPDGRLLIAIAGIPGSGKTAFSRAVADAVNQRQAEAARGSSGGEEKREGERPPVAVVVPMDGFHLTRAALSAMPDPERAHARRGAAFTFDGAGFLALVQRLRAPVDDDSQTVITCPAFDHAAKDPVADAIRVTPRQRVVLFEGNYLCLDRPPWRDAAALMDERWFVRVAPAVARARLVKRHLAAGIAADAAAAGRRADENDLVNGAEVVAERVAAVDEEIVSREVAAWALP